ncbi:unnamed protein product [Cyprideis torosa]|uniref:Uncharacterized protein n=1 Tax=Cyprideis torosa TaxID=163714 RepID=A0A7R8WND2_9CRUS|nr:unnamed protein product [Cyprideis torosa]CAG0900480.1 unnamed protein product [Cyprideis torosa]
MEEREHGGISGNDLQMQEGDYASANDSTMDFLLKYFTNVTNGTGDSQRCNSHLVFLKLPALH